MGTTTAAPRTTTSGYTGLNIQGFVSLQTEVTAAITLASGDVTLNNDQIATGRLEVTTGHATNSIVIPTGLVGKAFVVVNNDGALAANIKVTGGAAVTVAFGKSAIVQVDSTGNQVKRVTADA